MVCAGEGLACWLSTDHEEEEEEAEEEEEDKDPARQILTISSLGYTNIVIYLYA